MKLSERIRLVETSIIDDDLAIECLECADEAYRLEAELKVCEIERDALVRYVRAVVNNEDDWHAGDREYDELPEATRKEIEDESE